jgi:very-short-patch-repair endonuclease
MVLQYHPYLTTYLAEKTMKLILLLLLIFAVLMALSYLKAKGANEEGVWPFYAKSPLSKPEQVLYFRILQAMPEHIVLAQVQLSCLLGVKKGHNYRAWLNRINRMSADFVVCNKDSSIVAVIELDDATHQRQDRIIADTKKDRALTAAGIRVIRWQANSMPDVAAIRATLRPVITLDAE